MFKYKEIETEYGSNVLPKVREAEKLARSHGRHRSHLHFNLQCKHSNVIPKSLKIKSQTNTNEARNIIHRAELALLNLRISETVKKKANIKQKLDKVKNELQTILPPNISAEILKINSSREQNELSKSSRAQRKKFMRLKYGEHYQENPGQQPTPPQQTNPTQQIDNNQQPQQQHNSQQTMDHQQLPNATPQQEGSPQPDLQQQQPVHTSQEQPGPPQQQTTSQQQQARPIPTRSQPNTDYRTQWVKNLSSRTLSTSETELLSKGAGFAISPNQIPYDDFVVATEQACKYISNPGQKAALRAELTELLSKQKAPPSNLTKAEQQALNNLMKDNDIVIAQADKGKALVVMDKSDYINKMETKLNDPNTYEKLKDDPTNDIKEALSQQLRSIKEQGQLNDSEYYRLLPRMTQIPRLYGQPKIHKEGYPMREIVDSCGSITKTIDKHISQIIKKYVGSNQYHVKNSTHFVESIAHLKIQEDETLVSYDVAALYPSIPQTEAINLVHQKLCTDDDLSQTTTLSAENITKLHKICVSQTYFIFNNQLYAQKHGLAMGASTSGFTANIFMEQLETTALSTFIEPPSIWKRFVDDTFCVLKSTQIDTFLHHLNNQHPDITFTTEIQHNNQLPFLDVLIEINPDRTLKTSIYRKPTNTNQYLDYRSNHHVKNKIGIISTLRNRIDKLVTTEEDKAEEEKHITTALRRCGHPKWSLNRKKAPKQQHEQRPAGKVAIPYIKGVSEKIARLYRKHNINTIHKPTRTIKNTLCTKAKDPIHDLDKTGAIYHIECPTHQVSYVGETSRALKARAHEHGIIPRKESTISHSYKPGKSKPTPNIVEHQPTATRRSTRNKPRKNYKEMNDGTAQPLSTGNTVVSEHIATNNHQDKDIKMKILSRENNFWKRGIKEALAINQLKPNLNADNGRYNLATIYNNLPPKPLPRNPPRNRGSGAEKIPTTEEPKVKNSRDLGTTTTTTTRVENGD